MLLCEVFERFALVLPNCVRQSCVDDIFRDVFQIHSALKDIVKAIVLAVNGSKLINETIFLDFLNLFHEHFQFFECSQKFLVIICDTSPLIAIGVQKLSGAPWGLGLKVLDQLLNLTVGNLSFLYNGLIAFPESAPPAVRLLDDIYDLMLRIVLMFALIQAAYAICWLGEVIRASLYFALVEYPLALQA